MLFGLVQRFKRILPNFRSLYLILFFTLELHFGIGVLISSPLVAQPLRVSLSEKHATKLSRYENAEKRLRKYYKFYRKDSVRVHKNLHGHEERIAAAAAKMSKVLSRYRQFNSVTDLEGAVKQTSMKGKTVLEHLVFASQFNVVSTSFVSVDLSPQLGISSQRISLQE